jgi:hypothetical protein
MPRRGGGSFRSLASGGAFGRDTLNVSSAKDPQAPRRPLRVKDARSLEGSDAAFGETKNQGRIADEEGLFVVVHRVGTIRGSEEAV